MPVLDRGGDIDGVGGLAQRGFLLPALGRPGTVVVPGVLGQDVAEKPFAEDQHVGKALGAKGANETVRK